jgi:hypothetical protein
MRRFSARQRSGLMRWLSAALPVCAAMALGCEGMVGGTGGNGGGTGGTGVASCGPTSSQMVPAPQRIMLLTKAQIINTIRYLIDDAEATALVTSGRFQITAETDKHFPPADGEETTLNIGSFRPFNNMAEDVGNYVTTNFARLANCPTPTDACATTYLNRVAERAYRRALKPDEQTRFTELYNKLRSQDGVRGYLVTNTVERATGYAVNALLISPQLMWRWEIGAGQMSTSPPGIYLTDGELASQVSFFLTDQPPDDMLLADAKAGMLRTKLASHVSRILATQTSRNWMRRVMELYFLLNQLPVSPVDPTKFPVDEGLLASMGTEGQMFLDDVLWNGNVSDLLLSKTGYVNTRLADTVYKIPQPAGVALDKFVKVTLPADRAGMLTNAAFLTARSRSDGQDLVSRAKTVKAAFLCIIPPAPNLATLGDEIQAALGKFEMQTGQEQAAARAMNNTCKQCHATFDSFGLVLEYYDAIGAYRTTYSYLNNRPVDGTTTLPEEVGGATVHNAVEMAQALTASPTFTNCLAKSLMQAAMTDLSVFVELPLPPSQPGCAVADVVKSYESGPKTFTGMLTAVTQSPAFVLRKAAP